MATTIYFDDEARLVLEIVRKKDPTFNLSQYVKKCLTELSNMKDDTEEMILQTKMAKLLNEISNLNRELEASKQRLISLEEQKKENINQRDLDRKKERKGQIERLSKVVMRWQPNISLDMAFKLAQLLLDTPIDQRRLIGINDQDFIKYHVSKVQDEHNENVPTNE